MDRLALPGFSWQRQERKPPHHLQQAAEILITPVPGLPVDQGRPQDAAGDGGLRAGGLQAVLGAQQPLHQASILPVGGKALGDHRGRGAGHDRGKRQTPPQAAKGIVEGG